MLGRASYKPNMSLKWEGFGELGMASLFRSEVTDSFHRSWGQELYLLSRV